MLALDWELVEGLTATTLALAPLLSPSPSIIVNAVLDNVPKPWPPLPGKTLILCMKPVYTWPILAIALLASEESSLNPPYRITGSPVLYNNPVLFGSGNVIAEISPTILARNGWPLTK